MARNGSIPDWIPEVVEISKRRPPPSDLPEKAASRFAWVWKVLATVGSCLAAGAAGHAAVETWGSRFESASAAALVHKDAADRIKALEDWKTSETLTAYGMGRDVAELRRDLDAHKATSADSGLRPRTK